MYEDRRMEKINIDNLTFLVTTVSKDMSQIIEMVKKNRLFGNIIVGCQKSLCDEYQLYQDEKMSLHVYFETTVGTSVNRNFLIDKVQTKFCFFLDDDIKFLDSKLQILNEAVNEIGDFDFIFFDFCYEDSSYPKVKWRISKKIKPIQMRSYGTNSVLYSVDFINRNKLRFNENIGPGCYIYAGEDGQFLMHAAKVSKKAYSYQKSIIEISYENGSTWFAGHDERFFTTVGYTYHQCYGLLGFLFIPYTLVKHKKLYLDQMSFTAALKYSYGGYLKYYED